MAIREHITVDIATVDINDEYRVELRQRRKRQDYSPAQARALAAELIYQALAAENAIDEDMHERRGRLVEGQIRTLSGEVVL
ncbi:hypothetical protein [Leucobacter massiliensis]|uniref:Uncharacterized protein n=1 Tax=Leucobacter massiliensis TaxID=1686285 RepID=A0A2S9QQP5_9MICO|nr:hypothetical protein [Leucobacter massiliensis]PRI11904.1 hypothetical protein B4915_02170 [Leucobacter massiliensis]